MSQRTESWRRPVAVGTWNALSVAALVVAVKRWLIGVEPADSVWPACVLTLLTVGASLWAWRLSHDPRGGRVWTEGKTRKLHSRMERSLPRAATVFPPLLLGLGLLPDRALSAGLYAFGFVGIAVLWATFQRDADTPEPLATLPESTGEPIPDEPEEAEPNWFTESHGDADGGRLSGRVCLRFGAGERVAVAHVPFVPAFECEPQVELEADDTDDVRVRTTLVRTFGMRLEARRSDAGEEVAVAVAFEVWAPASVGDAA